MLNREFELPFVPFVIAVFIAMGMVVIGLSHNEIDGVQNLEVIHQGNPRFMFDAKE